MKVVNIVLSWVSILAGVMSGLGSVVLLNASTDRRDTYLLTASLFLFVAMFALLYCSTLFKKGEQVK